MTPEKVITKEQLGPLPTTLTLFRFRGEEFHQMWDRCRGVSNLVNELITVHGSLVRSMDETKARKERLLKNAHENGEQSNSLRRSASCSTAYLKMSDELSERGVEPPEIFRFYLQCLHINTYMFDFLAQRRGSHGEKVAAAHHELLSILDREVIPSWLGNDKDKWKKFLSYHANFPDYLKDFCQRYPCIPQLEKGEKLGTASKDALPDWLEDADGEVPDRAVVEKELIADLQLKSNLKEHLSRLVRQEDYLNDLMDQKFLKAIIYIEKRKKQVFPPVKNFSDVILFLRVMREQPEFTIDPLQNPTASWSQVYETRILAHGAHEKRLREVTQLKNILASKEAVALWLERILRQGGVIESAQDLITDDTVNLMASLFDEVAKGEPNQEFQCFRNTDRKRGFATLNNDIKPLLKLLKKDEIEYLQEFIKVSKGDPIESIVWAVAELVASRLKDEDSNILPTQMNIIARLQKFLQSWLGNNLDWADEQLYQSLKIRPQTQATATMITEIDSSESLENNQHPESPEVQEIDRLVAQSQRGNLAGWHLYYTVNRSEDPKSFIEIGTDVSTMHDREEAFIQFVGQKGIPCTVHPASIVRSLERLVMAPQEAEWIRMRMDVDGVVFKKQKHTEGMRTFFIMDPNNKVIVFFIYKKKDWSYRF